MMKYTCNNIVYMVSIDLCDMPIFILYLSMHKSPNPYNTSWKIHALVCID